METRLIQSDPNVMMGKPVIAGTRITVELVLEKLAAGETVEQLLEAHPRFTAKAISAALAFAAGLQPATKAELVAEVLNDHKDELLNAFSVITPGNVRIRRRITNGESEGNESL